MKNDEMLNQSQMKVRDEAQMEAPVRRLSQKFSWKFSSMFDSMLMNEEGD